MNFEQRSLPPMTTLMLLILVVITFFIGPQQFNSQRIIDEAIDQSPSEGLGAPIDFLSTQLVARDYSLIMQEMNDRPLFSETRRPQVAPAVVETIDLDEEKIVDNSVEEDALNDTTLPRLRYVGFVQDELETKGILLDLDSNLEIWVVANDSVQSWTVQSLTAERITLVRGDQQHVVEMLNER